MATELAPATLPLVESETPQRRFLPGFSRPAGSDLFGPVWPSLMEALQATSRSGLDVIVDAGRITRAGLLPPLIDSSDALLVCTGTSLRAMAGLRLYLPALGREATNAGTRLALVLIGQGRPYGAKEISEQFQVPVAATIAHDPSGAAVITDGAVVPRGFAASPFRTSIIAAASRISADLDAYLRPIRGGIP